MGQNGLLFFGKKVFILQCENPNRFLTSFIEKTKKNPNLKATSKMLYNITNKKMRVFLWIWKMIGPLVMIAGAIYTAFVLLNPDWSDDVPLETNTTFIIGGICALVGFILGFTGWAEDVAPRLFWIKGRVELLDNQIGYAITLAIQFFFIPAAIGAIIMLL